MITLLFALPFQVVASRDQFHPLKPPLMSVEHHISQAMPQSQNQDLNI